MTFRLYYMFVVGLSVVCGATIAAAIVSASTTISTNISTGGTLTIGTNAGFSPNFASEWTGFFGDRVNGYSLNPASTYGFEFHTQAAQNDTTNLSSSLTITSGNGAGVSFYSPVYTDTTDTVDFAESVHSDIITLQTGTLNRGYHFYVPDAQLRGVGTINTQYGFYSNKLTAATNNYYSWFDSSGVRRVKEDSTFNSVGQAIEALYNPQFTKYTPGATNYEPIILGQWNSNVAQIGTENGGTGSARALAFITASTTRMTIGADGSVGIGVTNSTVPLQVATPSSNATSTVIIGKTGQSKGSCLVMYDATGAVKYLSIQGGSLVVSNTSCQ